MWRGGECGALPSCQTGGVCPGIELESLIDATREIGRRFTADSVSPERGGRTRDQLRETASLYASRILRSFLLVLPPQVPELGVFHEDAEGAQGAEDEAVPAVQEAAPKHIHAEESPHRPQRQVDGARAPAFLMQVVGGPGSVSAEFFQILRERCVGVVNEVLVDRADLAVDDDVRVNFQVLVTPLAPPPQAHQVISVPAAVTDQLAEERRHALDRETVARSATFQDVEDARLEFGGDALVGVEHHDPIARGLRDGPVFLSGRVHIFVLDDVVGVFAGDVEGAVGREGIDHEDVVSPRNAFEAVAEVTFLVEGGHDHSDRLGHRQGSRDSASRRSQANTTTSGFATEGTEKIEERRGDAGDTLRATMPGPQPDELLSGHVLQVLFASFSMSPAISVSSAISVATLMLQSLSDARSSVKTRVRSTGRRPLHSRHVKLREDVYRIPQMRPPMSPESIGREYATFCGMSFPGCHLDRWITALVSAPRPPMNILSLIATSNMRMRLLLQVCLVTATNVFRY